MSFKKIDPRVIEAFEYAEIQELNEFGKSLFSSIKSGGHLFVTSPKETGKTEAAIVATFNKVNSQLEGSPRVLYICSSIEEVKRVHSIMTKIAWRLDVTVDMAHDKGDMVLQRNDIFNGTEIIVGTIKRIYDLYIQNGINFKLLDYLIVDDCDEILIAGKNMEIKRLIEGFYKTQLICLANKPHPRVDQFIEGLPFDIKKIDA